jgi:hypothetical protein
MTYLFLRSLKNIGHQIQLVQKDFTSRQEEIGRFSFLKVFKMPVLCFKIIKAAILFRPDLCFYFVSVKFPTFFIGALFLIFLKQLKVKYVLYSHDQVIPNIGSGSSKFANFVVNKSLSRAFAVIVLRENLKKDINQFIDDSKIFILPNAINDFEY